jgi:hypothetical protein
LSGAAQSVQQQNTLTFSTMSTYSLHRLRKRLEDTLRAFWVTATCDVNASDGDFTVSPEHGALRGVDDDDGAIQDALSELCNWPVAANTVASAVKSNGHVFDHEMLFGSTALLVELHIIVNNGTMQVAGVRVPRITAGDFDVISCLVDEHDV